MKQSIQNLRGTRGLRVLSLFLPFAALPLVAMGVTVPVAGGGWSGVSELAQARHNAEEAERVRRELATFGSLDQLDDIALATGLLRDLLPAGKRDVAIFNEARYAAEEVGLELRNLIVGEAQDTGLVVGETTAFVREVEISGVASLDQVWGYVEQLRSQGLPAVVFQASVSRGRPSDVQFQFTARLGVYHVGESSSGPASALTGE